MQHPLIQSQNCVKTPRWTKSWGVYDRDISARSAGDIIQTVTNIARSWGSSLNQQQCIKTGTGWPHRGNKRRDWNISWANRSGFSRRFHVIGRISWQVYSLWVVLNLPKPTFHQAAPTNRLKMLLSNRMRDERTTGKIAYISWRAWIKCTLMIPWDIWNTEDMRTLNLRMSSVHRLLRYISWILWVQPKKHRSTWDRVQ